MPEDFINNLSFKEGIRVIHDFCKARKKCGTCPMRIIPDGCWFKHYPSSWRLGSFLEHAGETLEWAISEQERKSD